MSSGLTKFSDITGHCLETTEEDRHLYSGGQFDSAVEKDILCFRNDRMGKCHFHCVRGNNGITSGIAWAPDEEFIIKDGLTLEQKQRTSVRIVRNRQNDLTR